MLAIFMKGTQLALMLKRAGLVLSVILLVVATVWLSRTGSEVKKMPAVDEGIRTHSGSPQEMPESPVEDLTEERVPTSPRHAADEIERYRASRVHLVELEMALRDQEEQVKDKRKALAAIVRTKGIIYKGNDSVLPLVQDSAAGSNDAEEPDPANKKDAEERGRDAMLYIDVKREFETDQGLLREMQLKLERERQRLKDEGK